MTVSFVIDGSTYSYPDSFAQRLFAGEEDAPANVLRYVIKRRLAEALQAEDEATYRRMIRDDARWMMDDGGRPAEWMSVYYAPTLTPERALAECEAKRRVVEEHSPYDEEWCSSCGDVPQVDYPCLTVRALAAVYADHPDYRDEWRA